CMQGLEYPYSF
nr:immunoglobulin light chain junction region [Macaca mulatta]MOV77990.1 immunoglobulin light chain junction region [Macaca mulatta]MOV78948.1 immunoglobulin light chain junction region [Macaca mulatta]MOV79803.1 immunoglobulin light chain junction region [Macaca mulatta]MOV81021.1 immunoglobulin light chain junction region [Macaca mulatta]